MDCKNQLAPLTVEERDYLEAIEINTDKLKTDPNNHELYFDRSVCHYKLRNYRASLDDADAAIRLNPTAHNLHYQKGLALANISCGMSREAMASFKKAIELRAKQEDSRLSDIFNLIKYAMEEAKIAKERNKTQQLMATTDNHNASSAMSNGRGTSNDPVDSTTDRPLARNNNEQSPGENISSIDSMIINGNNTNLVAGANSNNSSGNLSINQQQQQHHQHHHHQAATITNCANQQVLNASQLNRNGGVTSSANRVNNNNNLTSINAVSPEISSNDILICDHHKTYPHDHLDQSKAQFEWNIRRSERIFLHHSSEQPGASTSSGNQFGAMSVKRTSSPSRQKGQNTGSNPASISSCKSQKSLYDTHESQAYHATLKKSRDGTNQSHIESEIDVVDDATTVQCHEFAPAGEPSDTPMDNGKRLMIAPSSSMPATGHTELANNNSVPKDDSYSSKYKRLRRDRERARRGTSKLCTIKLSDLEDLQNSTNPSKRTMRVIAPIDGWLYSGQLSVDENSGGGGGGSSRNPPQYVVRLDGDTTGSSYLFTQETVLNDVIKEVRVKSVSDLRKGARICCYWSRTYKCLSTGVVTSRTFEATKSLVSVKYDNGDLSALPLEDLRLLPPDYPKYMSNCDPLLLARNNESSFQPVNTMTPENGNGGGASRVIVDSRSVRPANVHANSGSSPSLMNDKPARTTNSSCADISPEIPVEAMNAIKKMDHDDDMSGQTQSLLDQESVIQSHSPGRNENGNHDEADDDDDVTIPATHEAIDFITNETALDGLGDPMSPSDALGRTGDRVSITHDDLNIASNDATQLMPPIETRTSGDLTSFSIEYKPWVFEGQPKRSKRHGRTYRDNYLSIRRGSEVIKIGDSAELMPRDESILPFVAKIDGMWATSRGEMRVRVRWYYRLVETEGEPYELKDGDNALFETDHFDENDVQSIFRSTRILSWTEYAKNHLGHVNKQSDRPKIFYLAGYYDPVRRVKHLRSDVKEIQ